MKLVLLLGISCLVWHGVPQQIHWAGASEGGVGELANLCAPRGAGKLPPTLPLSSASALALF